MSHKLDKTSPRFRAKQALRMIRAQFPENPEGRLFFAILNQAVVDLFDKSYRHGAIHFFNGDMWVCEMCGVEPIWVRETLIKYGVSLDINGTGE